MQFDILVAEPLLLIKLFQLAMNTTCMCLLTHWLLGDLHENLEK